MGNALGTDQGRTCPGAVSRQWETRRKQINQGASEVKSNPLIAAFARETSELVVRCDESHVRSLSNKIRHGGGVASCRCCMYLPLCWPFGVITCTPCANAFRVNTVVQMAKSHTLTLRQNTLELGVGKFRTILGDIRYTGNGTLKHIVRADNTWFK